LHAWPGVATLQPDKTEARPVARQGAPRTQTSPPATLPDADDVAGLLQQLGVLDAWHRGLLAEWRRGYAAGRASHDGDYDRGVHDGAMLRKRAEHDVAQACQVDVARWGPLGRAHFGDHRPGDYPGRGDAT
jgi:hypothetical protein